MLPELLKGLRVRTNIEQIISVILEQEVNLNTDINMPGNIVIKNNNDMNIVVPNLGALSAGQTTLLAIFCSIIQASDMYDVNKIINLNQIEGVVLIDEVDLHLHIKLQKDILPKLIQLFPKVQFIVSTHSPFFLKGMHDLFKQEVLMLNMPYGTMLNNFSDFEEFENAFKVFDSMASNYREELLQLQSKLETLQKPLIITEGKTDWKHLKAALIKLKNENIFSTLDIDFFESKGSDEGGSSYLENLLQYASRFNYGKTIIGVFDRDEPRIIEKYNELQYLGNNVCAFCIPKPNNRKDYENISIEFYYTDDEIKTKLSSGTRLYFDNECSKISEENLTTKISIQTYKILEEPKMVDEFKKKIFDRDLSKTLNQDKKNPVAHSKEAFASNVLNGEFKDRFDVKNFTLIFNKIDEAIKHQNINDIKA